MAQLPPVIAVHAVGLSEGPTAHDVAGVHAVHTAESEHVAQRLAAMGLEHDVVVPHRVLVDDAHEPPLAPRQCGDLHAVHTPAPDFVCVASHVAQLPPAIALHAEGATEVPTAHDTAGVQPPHTAASVHFVQ